MLDTLRRNVRRLSWTLWLVIAAFIILYIPDLVAGGGGTVVARVDGRPIMASEFQRELANQVSYYRQLNEGNLPDDFLNQLQLDQVVLEQLIRRKLMLAAARDQGFAIAPQEIKDRIMEYPVFRADNGRWVGDQEYLTILRRNGLEPADFEASVVEDLLVERLTGLVTEGVSVNDAELQELYQRENERIRFDFVQVRSTAYELEVRDSISDADLQAHYDADPAAYRLPEQRRISYDVIDSEAMRDALELSEERLREEYEASVADFTIEEQIKARHILFRVTPGADDAAMSAVRELAEAALARVQAGEDFAALAEELSDDTSASAGGDLGWVTRGRQVEGFDEAAFALQPGDVSDVVETAFGYHVILVEDRREEQVQPFEEVRGQLEQRLAWDMAEDEAARVSDQVRRQVLSGTDLEDIAETHGLELKESPLFSQATGFGDLTSLEFTERVFGLLSGRVAEPVRVRQGFVVFRIDEIAPARTPPLEEVRDEVLANLAQDRARERAAEAAQQYAARLQAGEALEAVAQEAATVVDSTELITRNDFVPALGRAPRLMQAAFGLDAGEVGGPVPVDDRFVVFVVQEHVQPDWSLFGQQQDALRDQELVQRRNRLFEAFVQSLREQYVVRVYEDVVSSVAG